MKCILILLGACLLCVSGMVNAAEPTMPGLQLNLTSADGKTDSRVSRLAALFVPEKKAASPFISKGPFKADYTGFITLEARRRLFLAADGQGDLTVTITVDDDTIIEQSYSGTFSKTNESDRIRLNPGTYPIRLQYTSPDKGDAFFRLYWRESRHEWPQEPIPPTTFTHAGNSTLSNAQLLRHGRQLLADLHCAKCHSAGETITMPELSADAPTFDGIGSRLHKNWMAEWIKDPAKLRAQARMPKIHGAADSADDIAVWLGTLRNDGIKTSTGNISAGGQLFHDLGCIACHGMPGKEVDQTLDRISLNNINRKFKPGALAAFLKEPGKHYAWIRMPDFSLSDNESADLAAWLRSTVPMAKVLAIKGDAEKGKAAAIKNGCMNCHAPNDAGLSAPSLARLTWSGGCLDGKFADFSLSDYDKKALVSIKNHLRSLNHSSAVEFSQRQVKALNCTACHKRDGNEDLWSQLEGETAELNKRDTVAHGLDQSRPLLTWIGEKLNADWNDDLLSAELSYKPRPWLAARMPAFKSRAALLAEGLAHDHGFSKEKDDFAKDNALADVGKTLSGTAGFGCIVCHDFGKGKALAPFEVKGLNIGYAHDRLRYEYYMRWMQHPMRVVEGSKMPRYSTDGTSAVPLLDGSADKQYEAIWHYASDGMTLEPPEGAK